MRDLITRLMTLTHDGVLRHTFDDGRILLANRSMAQILDLDCAPEDLAGRYLKDLMIFTESADTLRTLLKEGHGEVYNCLHRFRTLKGNDKWVIYDAFLVNDPKTGNQIVEAIMKDISGLKRAEADLAQEKERLAITLQSIGDGVIAADIQGRITLINKVAAELTGWPEKEAVGRPLSEVFRIVNEQTRRPCDDPVKQVLQTGITAGLANHTTLIARDGTLRNITDSGAPIHDSQGNVNGVVLIFRNITEQRQMAEALRKEQEELQIIFDSCPAKIFFKDKKNRILRANKAFADSLGLRREDVEGKSAKVLFPEQAELYWESDKEVIVSGRPQTGFIVPLKTATGPSWAQVDKVPFRNKDGRIIGVVGFSIDITARINAENALKESESRYRQLVDNTDTGFVVIDETGVVLEANEPYMRLIGAQKTADAIGHSVIEWTAPEEQANNAAAVARCAAQGYIQDFETIYRRKDGKMINILINATIQETPRGKRLMSLCRNITERKQAEKERERLNQELSRANQELETLIRIVTHDLRSPLVNIQGFGQILNKTCGEITGILSAAPLAEATRRTIVSYHEKAVKSLRFINASVDKMNGLINGLLHLSRLGRAPRVNQTIDMDVLIKTVLEAMTFQIRASAAEVTVDALPACQGDVEQISQVFSNLLDNAIKYRDSARPLRVRIWGRREDAHTVYCIEDNGQGVAPEHQQKIWTLFYRLNPQGNILGYGLGLTVVQRIVEHHGGKIWMESEAGQGSRFFLSLPPGEEAEL